MAVLKYKDSQGNYQTVVGLNIQNEVVQTTGNSTTSVMSQKAVSDLIPAQASSSNQLADKEFVNSSITTATATYHGSYNLVSDLGLTISASHGTIEQALNTTATGADNNDYSFVQIPTSDSTPTEIASVERYKYNGTTWSYEYAINNSGFTAAQWAAVNSNITSGLVAQLNALSGNPQTSISKLFGMDASGNFQNISTGDFASLLDGYRVMGKKYLLGWQSSVITDIPINSMGVRSTYIYLASWNTSDGDYTFYEFGLLRVGYSENHVTKTQIAQIGNEGISPSYQGDYVKISNNYNVTMHVVII